jgi:hypothetical protein
MWTGGWLRPEDVNGATFIKGMWIDRWIGGEREAFADEESFRELQSTSSCSFLLLRFIAVVVAQKLKAEPQLQMHYQAI